MAQNLARDYADSMLESIRARVAAGTPYGIQHDRDGWADVDGDEYVDYRDNIETEWYEASGLDFLADVLDIKYVVNSDRTYRAAKVCVGCGGPNVWINTDTNELEVYWDTHETRALPREFVNGLDDALEELWEMGA